MASKVIKLFEDGDGGGTTGTTGTGGDIVMGERLTGTVTIELGQRVE